MNWNPPAASNKIAENNVAIVRSDGLRIPKLCAKNWVVTARIEKADQMIRYAAVKTVVVKPIASVDDILL